MAAAANVSAMDLQALLQREWLAVNHIGGFASSTLAAVNTRKYHGLLVASMTPPVRRMVLLSRVEETVRVGGVESALACSEYPGTIFPQGHQFLRAFTSDPFPRWAYQGEGWTLEKNLRLVRGQNTVVLTYVLLTADRPLELELRPLPALRGIHDLSFQWNGQLAAEQRTRGSYHVPATSRTPEVFFAQDGDFEPRADWYQSTIYRREQQRGYAGLEDLWTPGMVRWRLSPGQSAHFVCSTEPIELKDVLAPLERETTKVEVPESPAPVPDTALEALLHAAGQFAPLALKVEHERPVAIPVTQYPWASPSVRDALIALPGLLLVTRRFDEARALLGACVNALDGGLLPSELPEDGTSAPLYHGADTSLWFIHAAGEYLRYSGDARTVGGELLDPVVRIIRSYQLGTALGIRSDVAGGLLASHVPGQATTWMDAKVGDWVITPRQGRPVELNALWYNALRVAATLSERFDRADWAREFSRLADSVYAVFNARFWNEPAGCCFDVLSDHGADPTIRPNQLLAISLPHAVLEPRRWAPVLDRVRVELLTSLGLRTLTPNDPSYQGRYDGDVVARDRAYHQGSVYPWLLGPYVTAHLRTFKNTAPAARHAADALDAVLQYLQGAGLGQICELFDGDAPHRPGGAIACARSVGEVLRCYVESVLCVVSGAAGDVAAAAGARSASNESNVLAYGKEKP